MRLAHFLTRRGIARCAAWSPRYQVIPASQRFKELFSRRIDFFLESGAVGVVTSDGGVMMA